jgi:hypothetical protein
VQLTIVWVIDDMKASGEEHLFPDLVLLGGPTDL